MFRPRAARLTSAHVMSALALFVALGGTSYAVATLPKNSVGSAQVKDGSLTAKDLAAGIRTAGPAGARGPRGAEGPAGRNQLPSLRIADIGNDAKDMAVDGGGGQSIKFLRMPNLPAGSYKFDFAGSVAAPKWPTPGEVRVEIFCSVWTLGVGQPESSEARVSINGALLELTSDWGDRVELADVGTLTRSAPFDLWVKCTSNWPSPKVSMIHSKLAVEPVGDVTVVPQ